MIGPVIFSAVENVFAKFCKNDKVYIPNEPVRHLPHKANKLDLGTCTK